MSCDNGGTEVNCQKWQCESLPSDGSSLYGLQGQVNDSTGLGERQILRAQHSNLHACSVLGRLPVAKTAHRPAPVQGYVLL